MDVGARPRTPGRRRTAAGDFRSRRLGRVDPDDPRCRRAEALGHSRQRRGAAALRDRARHRGQGAVADRLRRRGMKRFAALLDQLFYQPQRNAKLRLLTNYFASTPDPDRGYALAAMTGDLTFQHAKAGILRNLAAERTDPVLFSLSYDYVGDLAETIALIWPTRVSDETEPPALGTIVETLHATPKAKLPALLAGWLDRLEPTGRWALIKLITGSLRIGVSARLAKTALAGLG